MRRKINEDTWKQIETAIAAGIGPREVARNMGLPEGTVLSHAKRKAISQQIRTAKAAATRPESSKEVTPFESAAKSMLQRGERYAERMAGISEKVVPHLESMEPADILDKAREIELHDRWSRRNYGLDDQPPAGGPINLPILINQSAVQIVSPLPETSP